MIDITLRDLEEEEATMVTNYKEAYCALDDTRTYLRQLWKYTDFDTEAEGELVDKIYEKFYEIVNERGVQI